MELAKQRSERLFGGLILLLTVLAAAGLYLPQGELTPLGAAALPAPRWVMAGVAALGSLVVYGGLGWAGLRLARRLGWPELLDRSVTSGRRWGLPILTGIGLGLLFIAVDRIAAGFHGLGPLPHPPFPTSLVASVAAGIGEETIFRLFFISFWVWIVSEKLMGGGGRNVVFWSVAALSGVTFAASHLPAVLFLYGIESPVELPLGLLVELFALNGALSLVAAWHLRQQGFLAAVGVHFWTDVLWHVVYGAF